MFKKLYRIYWRDIGAKWEHRNLVHKFTTETTSISTALFLMYHEVEADNSQAEAPAIPEIVDIISVWPFKHLNNKLRIEREFDKKFKTRFDTIGGWREYHFGIHYNY